MAQENVQIRFGFVKEKSDDKKSSIVLLKDVTIMNGDGGEFGPKFVIPQALQAKANHTELLKIPRVKSAVEDMKKVRNLVITVEQSIAELYFDSDQNGYFKDTWLDEHCEEDSEKPEKKIDEEKQGQVDGKTVNQLLTMINEMKKTMNEKKKISPRDTKSHMTLNDFTGSDDGPEWMSRFESECDRLEIKAEADKIVMLRAFMSGSAKGWADSCEKRSGDNKLWKTWRDSFTATYTKKNWTTVMKAFGYTYWTGSMTDYAIEKQRKLLNVDGKMSDRSMIDQIAAGLPAYARDKLDRDAIDTVNKLFEELAKIEVRKGYSGQNQSKFENHKQPKDEKKSKSEPTENSNRRAPCSICRHLGLPDNRHFGKRCRFEEKLKTLPVNLTTQVREEDEIAALMNLDEN